MLWLEFLNLSGKDKDVTISLYGSQCLPCLLSSYPSGHLRERSQVSTTAQNVTHWLTHWKGHLLSCYRQLERQKSRETNHQLKDIIKNLNSLKVNCSRWTWKDAMVEGDHDIIMVIVKPQPQEAPCSSPSARPGTASTKAPPSLC